MTNLTLNLKDIFTKTDDSRWQRHEIGTGKIAQAGDTLHLAIAPGAGYHNAQLCDYSYRAFDFHWQPPLRLTVAAGASAPAAQLRGTAGFGFWNHPFSPDVRRPPRLPRALWFFFGSPPNDMQLALDVPGHGWKAAALDALRPSALLLAPLALPALLLMRRPSLYRRLYPAIQQRLGISEALLDANLLAETHTYTLDWRREGATFAVDGAVAHEAPAAPRGRLGFIVWMDNQYAVVTPQGRFAFGVVPLIEPQWLALHSVTIEAG